MLGFLFWFLYSLAFVVIVLHGSKFTVIVDNIGHALSLPVDGLLDLLVFLLDYLVDLLG